MTLFTELWPGGPRFAQADTMRLSTDSVLLADFVALHGAQKGIDLGCASGAIALLLLSRESRLHMTGLELDVQAAELARENMSTNKLEARSRILTGDIRQVRKLLPGGSFDFVVANPPYYPLGSGGLSPDPARAAARGETACSLEDLCRAAAWLLPTGGRLFLVHKPERLSELMCAMSANGLEPKRLRTVSPRAERAPSLILVEGRRGGKPGLRFEAPLILAGADGSETEELRRIYHH